MNWLFPLVLMLHILVALGIIGLVLMQHGKGADMGAAFGSGASGSLFGASGSANFFSRSTAVLAAIFFFTSLTLGYVASAPRTSGSVVEGVVQSAPAATSTESAATGEASEAQDATVDPAVSNEKEIPR